MDPLCHWVWASDGFLFNMGANGAIDFAGGTVVHISAGISGLVAAIWIATVLAMAVSETARCFLGTKRDCVFSNPAFCLPGVYQCLLSA